MITEVARRGEVAADLSQEFWQNTLEFDLVRARARAEGEGEVHRWAGKLTGRQMRILARAMESNADASARALHRQLYEREGELLDFYLVAGFSKGKSEAAVVDVAQGALSSELMAICRKDRRGREGEPEPEIEHRYDKTALLFALYHRDKHLLRQVLHFDKVHKQGFASMVLTGAPRQQPRRQFSTFLTENEAARITRSLARLRLYGNVAEVQGVTIKGGRTYVFVRRTNSPGHIHNGRTIVHGFNAEWIVLDFAPDGRQVNIASKSISESVELADAIGSAFFGGVCHYVNQEKLTESDCIGRFLAAARDGENGMGLVEVNLNASPLDGAAGLRLTHVNASHLARSLGQFEEAFGSLLGSLPAIESVKVRFRNKRVSLKFKESETSAGQYEVRYTDHRLNGFERRAFEQEMRSRHGLTVLSTEKRYRD